MKQQFCANCGALLNNQDLLREGVLRQTCPRCGNVIDRTDTDPRAKFRPSGGDKRIAHKVRKERRPI